MPTGFHVGDYRIVTSLVSGGYRAIHAQTRQHAVIEVATYDQSGSIAWLDAAVHALDPLEHPGIARILAYGMLADDRAWIAIENRDGVSLHDALLHRLLRADEIASLIHDVAEVLGHAHERGVIHGALRAQSIVLATPGGQFPVVVGDWVAVQPSPRGADGQTDIHALGVLAFLALTGAYPEPFVTHVPGAPPALARLMSRLLAPAPADRPTAPDVQAATTLMLGSASGGGVGADTQELDEQDDEALDTPPWRPAWTPAAPLKRFDPGIGAPGKAPKL